MQNILSQYRKAIITGGGVLIFLFAGLITMLVLPSENDTNNPTASPEKSAAQPQHQPPQNQNITAEPAIPKIWYVYVTGEVKNPGVYKLSEDARIFQAVEAAGGLTSKADAEAINMAETLADGVHVHIGAKASQNPRQSSPPRIPGIPASHTVIQSGVQATSHAGTIDINRANAQELEALPGIGPAIAKRIIDYRQAHGNFSRPDDLVKVRGIGTKTMENIRPLITAMNNGSGTSAVIHSSGQASMSSGGKIDINRASAKELEALPGVGPAIAKRIIDYRQAHGNFTRPEDLRNVRGIGSSKLEKIREQIVIR